MAIRTFSLTAAQAAELRQGYERTTDGSTRTRLQAVRLYGSGYSVSQIQEICGCSRTSLMDWRRRFHLHGIAGLHDHRLGGNRAKLTPNQRETVRANLHQYTPRQLFGPATATVDGQFWTISDLKRAVQEWFGVTWDSPTSYHTLLNDSGFSYQRTQKVFKSRSEREVLAFEEQLEKN
jgi:transposase